MSAATDAANLDRLVDIVEPDASALWWPPAPGVIALMALACVWGAIAMVRWVSMYRSNAYRREAVAGIEQLRSDSSVAEINAWLKRAAVYAFPRGEVASLSGGDWVAFLNHSLAGNPLSADAATALRDSVYRDGSMDAADYAILVAEAKRWLIHHRR